MNIYVRYFDQEALTTSYEELMEFLTSIPEIPVTQELMDIVRAYMDSPMPYPKRYKVRPRVYFILIKTTAQTMQEFKMNRNQVIEEAAECNEETQEKTPPPTPIEQYGWYESRLMFKRVVLDPETEKCQYVDTEFSAYVRANSELECYNRIKDYIMHHKGIDARSQIPSVKSNYFECKFVGEEFPEAKAN